MSLNFLLTLHVYSKHDKVCSIQFLLKLECAHGKNWSCNKYTLNFFWGARIAPIYISYFKKPILTKLHVLIKPV